MTDERPVALAEISDFFTDVYDSQDVLNTDALKQGSQGRSLIELLISSLISQISKGSAKAGFLPRVR
jgi:hypothetical protein